jgi:hypothetical protein
VDCAPGACSPQGCGAGFDGGVPDAGSCGGISCSGGAICCGGGCVDPKLDPANCGGCGGSCGGGEACVDGKCACDSMHRDCGGVCKTLDDPDNCGSCGKACLSGSRLCAPGGVCQPCSAVGQLECAGKCVDPGKDQQNCGGCDRACPGGQACVTGRCVGSSCGANCPTGDICCGAPDAGATSCVDPNFDPANCGGCGLVCTGGKRCQDGKCTCDAMSNDCNGTCRLFTDPDNCGACGIVCQTGARYCGGAPNDCRPCSTVGQTDCSGRCVDTSIDPANCGDCGLACAPNHACIAKACATAQSP